MWLEQSLNQFKETLLNYYQPNRSTGHAPLERTVLGSPAMPSRDIPTGGSGASTPSSSSTATASTIASSPVRRNVLESFGKLMSACVILRIEDFTLHRVTTAEKKQMPKEFISGEEDWIVVDCNSESWLMWNCLFYRLPSLEMHFAIRSTSKQED